MFISDSDKSGVESSLRIVNCSFPLKELKSTSWISPSSVSYLIFETSSIPFSFKNSSIGLISTSSFESLLLWFSNSGWLISPVSVVLDPSTSTCSVVVVLLSYIKLSNKFGNSAINLLFLIINFTKLDF